MTLECLHCVFTALSKGNIHASSEWIILTLNGCGDCTFVKKRIIQSNWKQIKYHLYVNICTNKDADLTIIYISMKYVCIIAAKLCNL